MALLLNHPGCQADATCPAVYLLPIRAAFLLPFLTAYLLPFFMHFHCAAPSPRTAVIAQSLTVCAYRSLIIAFHTQKTTFRTVSPLIRDNMIR